MNLTHKQEHLDIIKELGDDFYSVEKILETVESVTVRSRTMRKVIDSDNVLAKFDQRQKQTVTRVCKRLLALGIKDLRNVSDSLDIISFQTPTSEDNNQTRMGEASIQTLQSLLESRGLPPVKSGLEKTLIMLGLSPTQ